MKESNKNCPECHGRGEITRTIKGNRNPQHLYRTYDRISSTRCSKCNGTGEISRADKEGSSIFSWIAFIIFIVFMTINVWS